LVPLVSLTVIDDRIKGAGIPTIVDSLRKDSRSAGIPIFVLAAPEQMDRVKASMPGKGVTVLSLMADADAFKTAAAAVVVAAPTAASEDIRENLDLLRRVLSALAVLPPGTKYPTQGLAEIVAGLLKNRPNDVRSLALKVIANLPEASVRDRVYDLFVNRQDPVELRRDAGNTLLVLLPIAPDLAVDQRNVLRKLTADADETIRTEAVHALALATTTQAEREARLLEIGAAALTPPAPAVKPAAPKAASPAAPSPAKPADTKAAPPAQAPAKPADTAKPAQGK
jgi:hypothetical protein